jgi:Lar family restriction alleviation protein
MSEVKLKPCPFCGETEDLIIHLKWSGYGESICVVKCWLCYSEGPAQRVSRDCSEYSAVNRWNRRAGEIK